MNDTRKALNGAAAMLAAAVLAGCSFGSKLSEQPASYDLGPPRAAAAGPRIAAALVLPEVSAPAWLSSNGIIYRLNYDNAAQTHAYTLSRWTAPPPALLTQIVRNRFAAAAVNGIVTGIDGVRADYMLRVELVDFSQLFDTAAASRGTVRARASLISLSSRALVAQREFFMEQAAPTPDAAGGVQALSAASDEFVETLLKWAEERLGAVKGK